MARDAVDLDHPVLNALAGHARRPRVAVDRAARRPSSRAPTSAPRHPTRSFSTPMPSRKAVLARIAAGHSLAVAHPARHRRHPDRDQRCRSARARRQARARRERAPLDPRRRAPPPRGHRPAGLAVSPRDLQRDLIRAIGRNEKATQPKVGDIDDALVRLRGVLRDYRSAVTSRHPVPRRLGARRAPARSRSSPNRTPPPTAAARFDIDVLARLAPDRAEAAAALAAAARLGEFRFGPDDSPWYGVSFATTSAARSAHALAGKLHRQDIPNLLERGYELIAQTRMRPFHDDQRARRVPQAPAGHPRLARPIQPDGVRASAGRAHPGARSAPRRPRSDRRQPPPAAPALARVRAPRRARHRHARGADAHPAAAHRVAALRRRRRDPRGSARTRRRPRRVAARAMPNSANSTRSSAAPEPTGSHRCRSPSSCAPWPDWPPSPKSSTTSSSGRSCAVSSPRSGSSRCWPSSRCGTSPRTASGDELEFAWWQSALERLLRSDRALLGANTAVVDRLERDFRLVDEAHAAASGPLLAAQLATQWRIGIVDEAAEAAALKHALKNGGATASTS